MRRTLIDAFAAADRGLQSRIADALGVRPQTVNKWAKGQNLPEPDTWKRLEPLLRSEGLISDLPPPREVVTTNYDQALEARLTLLISGMIEALGELRAEVHSMRVDLLHLVGAEGSRSVVEVKRPRRSSPAVRARDVLIDPDA